MSSKRCREGSTISILRTWSTLISARYCDMLSWLYEPAPSCSKMHAGFFCVLLLIMHCLWSTFYLCPATHSALLSYIKQFAPGFIWKLNIFRQTRAWMCFHTCLNKHKYMHQSSFKANQTALVWACPQSWRYLEYVPVVVASFWGSMFLLPKMNVS